ncbi:MAG: hypothetical protein CVV28_02415 [Methanobacteriales archaeon HGW-Methanobacteriales-1]|jgi:hypothetical protein|nr:MAG: hypothetical protein CVV28_02415 [Methanobacteriales archaeon HGW-Methanobacteriales-1]
MLKLISYYFSTSRTLHKKPAIPVYLSREVLVLAIILSLILIGAAALATSEGPHYYLISQGA